jgi:hypothetical protein
VDSPLDKQMAEIKDKADLIKWVGNLPDDLDGIILVNDPASGRITVRHLGKITLKSALWNIKLYEQWILLQ